MMIVPALFLVLATAQGDQQETQTEQLLRLKWELQEIMTDDEWKPEKRGVDWVIPDTA